MTKKEFKSKCDFHVYSNSDRRANVNAIFYDRKCGQIVEELPDGYKYLANTLYQGAKYCIYARAANATKKVLEDTLYDFIEGKIVDVPWYIQLIVAEKDYQRFKVPLVGSGLNNLIKYPSL